MVDNRGAVEPFAWGRVGVVVAAAAVVLGATAGRYGYHRDELYFLEASKHLSWGYDDQPPLVPFLIHFETALFGDSVRAVRILPTVFALGLVVIAALCARELGGTRRAQLIAAACVAATGEVLILGHLFVTANPDNLCWGIVLLLILRWLRTRSDWLWPAVGVVAGVGLLNNNLVTLLGAVLALSFAIAGPRDVFHSRSVWFGAFIAVALWTPYLVWQASHGWPELKMIHHISSDGSDRALVVPFLFEVTAVLAPVWIVGWWRLAFSRELRAYRMLGFAFPLVVIAVIVTGGKQYYPAGFFPLLFGAGAVAVDGWLLRGVPRRRTRLLAVAVGLMAAVTIVIATPALPVKTYAKSGLNNVNKENGETVGWPQLAAQVADVYRRTPGAVLVAENYGVAGALAHYGPGLGLPTAYAPHDGYYRFGRPVDSATGPVIVVGDQSDQPPELLSGCTVVGRVDNGVGLKNQEQGWPIWLCAGPHEGWSTLWPKMLHYD